MASLRAHRGLLRNFLDSFVSRNTDIDGYWAFGFIDFDAGVFEIDLLQQYFDADSNASALRRIAADSFRSQSEKDGVARCRFRSVTLKLLRSAVQVELSIGTTLRPRYLLQVQLHAVDAAGRTYAMQRSTHVSPHDEQLEQRSNREHRGR